MGRSFPNDGTRKYLSMDLGAIGSLSAYSLIALINPDSSSRGAALTLRVSSVNKAQIIIDSGSWFGGQDFTGMAGSLAPQAGDWQVIGLTHAAGSNVYRWHYWNYTDGGSTFHSNGTWTVGNPGAIDEIRLGDGDNESKGDVAVLAVWDSVLSDGDFDTLATDQLSDWMALDPTALWADDLETDLTGGGADLLSTTGTVDVGTDPPGFNYALGSDITFAGTTPAVTGAFTVDALDDVQLAGTTPAVVGAFTVEALSDLVLGASTPAVQGAFTVNASSDITLAGVTPMVIGHFSDQPENPVGSVSISAARRTVSISAEHRMTVEAS